MIKYVGLDTKTVDGSDITFPEENPFDIEGLWNYRYKTEGEVKAVVMYFHEFGGYTGRYAYYAKYFAEQGYDFVGFDFRGFGKSEGMRGHIDSWEQHIGDCWKYYDIVRGSYDPSIPIIGCGFSFGGGTLLNLVTQREDAFKCVVLIAPFVGFQFGKHPYYSMAKSMINYYPKVRMGSFQKYTVPHMKFYNEDPLILNNAPTASTIVYNCMIGEVAIDNIAKMHTNMQIIVGDSETVVDRAAMKRIIKESPAEVKEYLEYPGVDHFVLNDGIHLNEIIKSQLDFISRMLS